MTEPSNIGHAFLLFYTILTAFSAADVRCPTLLIVDGIHCQWFLFFFFLSLAHHLIQAITICIQFYEIEKLFFCCCCCISTKEHSSKLVISWIECVKCGINFDSVLDVIFFVILFAKISIWWKLRISGIYTRFIWQLLPFLSNIPSL